MPGRRKGARGAVAKKAVKTQRKSEDLESQGGELSVEKLRYYLEDFDSQAPKKVKQYVKAFEREAKRLLKNELDQYKKSIPKNILKMPYREFQARGGNVEDVHKSLMSGVDEDVLAAPTLMEIEPPAPPPSNIIPDVFCTPANPSRRSQRIQMSTARRTARPAEKVVVSVQSEQSNSPLNEDNFMKQMHQNALDEMGALMLERLTAVLPQCHKSKVLRGIKDVKAQVMESERDYTVTPSIATRRRK